MNRNLVSLVVLTAIVCLPGIAVHAQDQPHQPPARLVGASADNDFNTGVDLQFAKKFTEAIAKYTDAIAKRKVFTDAYLNRGICYSETSEFDKAIADFDFYIYRKPDRADGYINRADVYRRKKEFDKALDELKIASEKTPRGLERLYLIFHRGWIYHDIGDYQRTISEYNDYMTQSIAARTRIEPLAYRNRGDAYMMRYRALEKLGATAESKVAYDAAQRDFAEYAKTHP